MNAIEFETTIESNGMIELPDKYKNFSYMPVKVIILRKEDTGTKEEVARQYAQVKAVIEAIQD